MATQLTILVIQKFCILHHKLLATTKAFINASLARWCSDSIWCPVWCDAKFCRNVCSPMANYRGIEIKVSSKYSSCRLEFSRSSAFCNNKKCDFVSMRSVFFRLNHPFTCWICMTGDTQISHQIYVHISLFGHLTNFSLRIILFYQWGLSLG